MQSASTQLVQGLLQRLDALANKLGTTAQALWNIYVAQARVEVVEDVVLFLIGLLLGVAGWQLGWFFRRRYMMLCEQEQRYNDYNVGAVITWVLGTVVCVIFCAIALGDVWTPLLNPQYWAFHQILSDLRNGQ